MRFIKKAVRLGMVFCFFLGIGFSQSIFGEEKVYYSNDFEEKDDVVFLACGNPYCGNFAKAQEERCFIFLSKGLTDEKAYLGAKSLKLDIIPDKGPEKGTWNYWRGPKLNIALSNDKPIHFSGYLYWEKVPKDILVRFGLSFRFKKDGKYLHGYSTTMSHPLYYSAETEKGWIHQKTDICEIIKKRVEKYGYDEKDILLEYWEIQITSLNPEGFHGERVEIYVDDVKISSGKEEVLL